MDQDKKKTTQQNEPMEDLEELEKAHHQDSYAHDYIEEERHQHDEDQDDFEKEFYEPAITSTTSNIVGWTIAVILFILAIWLLWIALR